MKPAEFLAERIGQRPVLVLGKGPSLTRESFDRYRQGACVVGINQTVRTFECEIAFFIDIEPFFESQAEILASKSLVVLPWHPNKRTRIAQISKPSKENLLDLCQNSFAIKRLNDEGRLFYFHTQFRNRRAAGNVFEPNLVSLSALLQILARVSIKDVRTLGVDGGKGRSTAVNGSAFTQLSSGYDRQFPILRRIAMTTGISMTRADSEEIRIFVGCEPEQWLPAKLLEYTIRKHTNEKVEIRQLHTAIQSKNILGAGRTPFSHQRFFIPELCGYKGMAIYVDSDMQVFSDIRELLKNYKQGLAVMSAKAPPGSGRRAQYSVMIVNCELAHWNANALMEQARNDYEKTMFEFGFESLKSDALPYEWNSLELYEPGRTKLLHYTDMDVQPWISNRNKLAPIWIAELNNAMRDGFITFDEVRRCVELGHARPGLLYQVENDLSDPLKLPKRERMKDELFVPPHTVARFTKRNGPLIRAGLAVARRVLQSVRGSRV